MPVTIEKAKQYAEQQGLKNQTTESATDGSVSSVVPSNNKKKLKTIGLIALVGVAAYALYYFVSKKGKASPNGNGAEGSY